MAGFLYSSLDGTAAQQMVEPMPDRLELGSCFVPFLCWAESFDSRVELVPVPGEGACAISLQKRAACLMGHVALGIILLVASLDQCSVLQLKSL